MYSSSGFSDWEIGDITVIIHEGTYHLFHLIIPNHDYIAHAVSTDGLSWQRVKNALFVGHPGDWDDDQLWTMHVCQVNGKFEMYYTGLKRRDRGLVSRVGFAESDDLIDWKKNQKGIFPIEPRGVYYEAQDTNPRRWLSFRDPFRIESEGEVYLLVCARTTRGPVNRRGCVGVIKITNDQVERLPPLVYPMVYDDIECPCAFELNGRYYVLGSIREDVKVRYWFAPEFFGEYHSFHDDVLLPQGNYAARTVQDGEHLLIFNFFFTHGKINSLRVLPPPKQLSTDEKGRLQLRSYYRWESMVTKTVIQSDITSIICLFNNPLANLQTDGDKWILGSRGGYEIFCFKKPASSFIWEGLLTVEGLGKLGLVTDLDNEGSGYFISFDVINGITQIRAWGHNSTDPRQNFIFDNIQTGAFPISRSFQFKLIRFGRYIELSVNNIVKLTLIDYTFSGNLIGLYSASSVISLQKTTLRVLPDPINEYGSQEETHKATR